MNPDEPDQAQMRYERLVSAAGPSLSADARARVKRRFKSMLSRISVKGETMSSIAYDPRIQLAPANAAPSRLLAAGVMIALAAGLFAMVSHRPGLTPEDPKLAAAAPGIEEPIPFSPSADDDGRESRKPKPTVFDTPDAALKALLEALSAGDVATMETLLHSRAGVEALCGAENIKLLEQKDKATIEKFKQNGKMMNDAGLQVKYADDKKDSGTVAMGIVTLPLGVKKTDKGWSLTVRPAEPAVAVGRDIRPEAAEQLALIEAELAALKARLGQEEDKGAGAVKHAPLVHWRVAAPPAPAPIAMPPAIVGIRVMGAGAGARVMAGAMPEDQVEAPAPAVAPKELTADERKALVQAVQDLGSEDFNTRDTAKKRLKDAGATAKDILETGLKSEDAERSHACKEMLDNLANLANGGRHKARGANSSVIQSGDGTWTIEMNGDGDLIPIPVPEPVEGVKR